jgi:hypothetical protein
MRTRFVIVLGVLAPLLAACGKGAQLAVADGTAAPAQVSTK